MAANKPATENNYAHLAGAFISPHPILAKFLLSEGEYEDAPFPTRGDHRYGRSGSGCKCHSFHCYQKPIPLHAIKYLLRLRSCIAIPLLYYITLLLTMGPVFLWKRRHIPGNNVSYVPHVSNSQIALFSPTWYHPQAAGVHLHLSLSFWSATASSRVTDFGFLS